MPPYSTQGVVYEKTKGAEYDLYFGTSILRIAKHAAK